MSLFSNCLINLIMLFLKFVEEFLNNCLISKTASLKNACWTKLLKEISNRFVIVTFIRCHKNFIGISKETEGS